MRRVGKSFKCSVCGRYWSSEVRKNSCERLPFQEVKAGQLVSFFSDVLQKRVVRIVSSENISPMKVEDRGRHINLLTFSMINGDEQFEIETIGDYELLCGEEIDILVNKILSEGLKDISEREEWI
jgi:hypothetical protein